MDNEFEDAPLIRAELVKARPLKYHWNVSGIVPVTGAGRDCCRVADGHRITSSVRGLQVGDGENARAGAAESAAVGYCDPAFQPAICQWGRAGGTGDK